MRAHPVGPERKKHASVPSNRLRPSRTFFDACECTTSMKTRRPSACASSTSARSSSGVPNRLYPYAQVRVQYTAAHHKVITSCGLGMFMFKFMFNLDGAKNEVT